MDTEAEAKTTNKRVATLFFERMSAGDYDGVLALCTADATFWHPAVRKAFDLEHFGDSLRWSRSQFQAPIRFELGPMIGEGNQLCILAESFATTAGGKAYNNCYNFYIEFRDGLVSGFRDYCDTGHVRDVLPKADATLESIPAA